MESSHIDEVATDLYAGPLGEFVASRNARAKEATDRETAARIRAMRKPTLVAWVVNVFAVERTAQLDEALRLAQDLRQAQAGLDAAALAQLGRERRTLTRRLDRSRARQDPFYGTAGVRSGGCGRRGTPRRRRDAPAIVQPQVRKAEDPAVVAGSSGLTLGCLCVVVGFGRPGLRLRFRRRWRRLRGGTRARGRFRSWFLLLAEMG